MDRLSKHFQPPATANLLADIVGHRLECIKQLIGTSEIEHRRNQLVDGGDFHKNQPFAGVSKSRPSNRQPGWAGLGMKNWQIHRTLVVKKHLNNT